MKKKIDSRVQQLIDHGLNHNHRSIFVIIGDKGRDQVVNLHYLVTQNQLKNKPKVLWCYKKDLGFSSHQVKRQKQLKKQQYSQSLNDQQLSEPFTLFLSSNQIRYCYYADTHKILGNTYNMLILQDFEALTPNTLCRTVETVEGGGLIIFLIQTLSSLKQLYSLTMDIHHKFKTYNFQQLQPRFNQRFILSLSTLSNCIFMDDELNLLPISSSSAKPLEAVPQSTEQSSSEKAIQELAKSLTANESASKLVSTCKTLD